MAEVIAIVASGISIVQIAAQVADCIVSIKKYWGRVKAAPDDIKHLLREVEAMSVMLHHIRDDLTQNTLPDILFDDSCVRQSFELCRDGAAELEQLVKDLAEAIDGKSGLRKKISAARALTKKDDVKRLKQRLKSSIRLLSLGYQCYTNAMIRLQPDIIVARLSTTMALSSGQRTTVSDLVTTTSCDTQMAETSESHSNDVVVQYYSYWTSSPYWLRFLFGSFEYHSQNNQRRGQSYQRLQAWYIFPEWFSRKVWDVCSYRSLSDWSVNIRTYRIIPDDAPIFQAIRDADILRVQNLLASKEALVTDRDGWGTTLLHKAIEKGVVDICKLLISEGADVCLPTFYNSMPLQYASWWSASSPLGKEGHQNIIRLLIGAGASSGLIRDIDALIGFCGDKDVFRYLQQQTLTPYYDLSPGDRFRVAESIDHTWSHEAELTRIALVQHQFDQETVVYADEYGITSLSIVTRAFAKYCCWLHAGESYIDAQNYITEYEGVYNTSSPWRGLVKDVVTAGASLHAINGRRRGILGDMILAICQSCYVHGANECFAAISQILKIWLKDLRDVGVDLVRYGADEKSLHLTETVNNTFECWRWFDENEGQTSASFSYRFSYGPRPEDWHFWFSEPTDVFAGEFWEMIENPAYASTDDLQVPIPGSWTESWFLKSTALSSISCTCSSRAVHAILDIVHKSL